MTGDHGGGIFLGLGLATGITTYLGGLGAFRLRSAMQLLLGFGAGAVTGVAIFDLLPEAWAIARDGVPPGLLAAAMAGGVIGYVVFDRLVLRHRMLDGKRGHLRAAVLTGHSLMDGLGVGLAFQASAAAGAIVALGILAHDLADGANTVTLSLSGGSSDQTARRWLAADALAPTAGMALSSHLQIPATFLALGLALLAGLFLGIGVFELLPRSMARQPRPSRAAAALAGLGLIYVAVRLAG